jgi:hypothetical protein
VPFVGNLDIMLGYDTMVEVMLRTAIVLIIASLRQRLGLIAIIQTCSPLAFNFYLSVMISLYFGIDSLGTWLFFLSIILMVAAMIQFTIEIQIANSALDVHLSHLKKHQKWQDYLATSKSRGKKSRKAVLPPPPPPYPVS